MKEFVRTVIKMVLGVKVSSWFAAPNGSKAYTTTKWQMMRNNPIKILPSQSYSGHLENCQVSQ